MTLPLSGPLSLSQMNAEFGGGGSLSGYYAGGGHVPNPTGSVPTSGALSFSEFLGTQNALEIFTLTIGTDSSEWGYYTGLLGSLSPTTTGFAGGNEMQAIIWLSANSHLYVQIAGNVGACFTSVVINGNTYNASSAIDSSGNPVGAGGTYDGGNDWTLWQWSTGNPIGTSGTISVTFH